MTWFFGRVPPIPAMVGWQSIIFVFMVDVSLWRIRIRELFRFPASKRAAGCNAPLFSRIFVLSLPANVQFIPCLLIFVMILPPSLSFHCGQRWGTIEYSCACLFSPTKAPSEFWPVRSCASFDGFRRFGLYFILDYLHLPGFPDARASNDADTSRLHCSEILVCYL